MGFCYVYFYNRCTKGCFVAVAFYMHVTLQHYDQHNKFIHHFEVFYKIFQVGSLTGKGRRVEQKSRTLGREEISLLGSARSGERSKWGHEVMTWVGGVFHNTFPMDSATCAPAAGFPFMRVLILNYPSLFFISLFRASKITLLLLGLPA